MPSQSITLGSTRAHFPHSSPGAAASGWKRCEILIRKGQAVPSRLPPFFCHVSPNPRRFANRRRRLFCVPCIAAPHCPRSCPCMRRFVYCLQPFPTSIAASRLFPTKHAALAFISGALAKALQPPPAAAAPGTAGRRPMLRCLRCRCHTRHCPCRMNIRRLSFLIAPTSDPCCPANATSRGDLLCQTLAPHMSCTGGASFHASPCPSTVCALQLRHSRYANCCRSPVNSPPCSTLLWQQAAPARAPAPAAK